MNFAFQKYFSQLYPKNIVESINLLEDEVQKSSFTAWSFANKHYSVSAFWADEYELEYFKNNVLHPVFDLASLTKPLFINLFLMLEKQEKYFEFIATPLVNLLDKSIIYPQLLENFIKKNSDLNLNSFLSHKTGLMSWCWMGEKSLEDIQNFIFRNKINTNRNETYSDLNYFILARLIEFLFILDGLTWEFILNKINSTLKTNFMHASIQPAKRCLPYFSYGFNDLKNESHSFFGFTHDTNANILSMPERDFKIVSGHSGFFGNLDDIINALEYLIYKNIFYHFSKEKNAQLTRFVFGFDTPSSPNSTAGIHNFDENKNKIFGHLGYTGTSLWLHSELEEFHILLTNRTAKRKKKEKGDCPRLYIIENRITKEKKIYSYSNKSSFIELTFEEAKKINNKNYKNNLIFWDKNIIPNYQDLSQIRKQIGLNLWGV